MGEGAIIFVDFPDIFISIHARLLFLIQSSFYTNNDCGVLTTVLHIFSFKSALISHKAKFKSPFSFFKKFSYFQWFSCDRKKDHLRLSQLCGEHKLWCFYNAITAMI